ncbi:hypothetical protein WH95_15145 [Kiloniella litopenaei]|uniref:DUF3179 domain-containing protein n=1 Tax=Kiloniella litopenaei TaxID=1549748 RepID=A0A0M2R353_9PROT|nr:DUF3179 domain-containing protein [Kiloniella litopenaei]KKJ76091.1 hypothetical protein WH95_15145 [Kiloniella litopenaei]
MVFISAQRAFALLLSMFLCVLPLHLQAQNAQHTPLLVEQSLQVVVGSHEDRDRNLAIFEQRGKTDVVPALIQALRFQPDSARLRSTLVSLTGQPDQSWGDWMLWQEEHPEVKPFDGFDIFKARVAQLIDPNFADFLFPGVRHSIRLEEIAWGGVQKDGIPSLDRPGMIPARKADYMHDDDLVFGVSINGDTRAYPLRIMNWHEMFNDVIGGVPVALAYCTLCGSGILYETDLGDGKEPLIFGSSGFLYRSNKLMFDRRTHSLWNQFTGRPVVGTLTGTDLELKTRPVTITNWEQWKAHHPKTTVLDIDTGFRRDYGSGVAYSEYFASPELMFPALVDQSENTAKSYVFVLRIKGREQAWPLSKFRNGQVIEDTIDGQKVILIGDEKTRTVRAYAGNGDVFSLSEKSDYLESNSGRWKITEDALVLSDGRKLKRLPGHISYWFAWNNYSQSGAFAN